MMLRLTIAAAVLAVTAGAAVPVQAQDAQRMCDEVLVEMSDGVRLHTWVRRLPPDRPRPVLLEIESYARPDNQCPDNVPNGENFSAVVTQDHADRFALVHVSKRGTGSSEGVYDVVGPDTQRDIKEVIAWAREQPWSNGDIVLIGGSGTAFFTHHGLQEPGVVLAMIYTSCADMYRCFRRGGGQNGLAGVYLGVTGIGYQSGLRKRELLGTALNPAPPQQLAGLSQGLAETAARETFDGWWAERSALDHLPDVEIPVLYTTDVYDIVMPYEALQLTPNAHFNIGLGHTVSFVDDTVAANARQLVNAVVFGEGEIPEDRVTLATSLGSVETWRNSQVLVRTEPSWPLPDTDWTVVHLSDDPSGSAESLNDGSLSLAVPEVGDSGPAPLVSSPGVRADYRTVSWLVGSDSTTDFRDEEQRGLTYTSPVLQESLEVSGPITASIWATSVLEDFDWSVRLTNVHPDGRSEWVSDGYLRATLRRVDEERSLRNDEGVIVDPWHTFDTPELVPVNEPVQYQIDVIPTSAVFRAGHRLRLDIFPVASGPPDQPVGAGALTVLHGPEHPSHLLLPVIPRGCDRSTPLVPSPTPVGSCAVSYGAATGESGASPPPGVDGSDPGAAPSSSEPGPSSPEAGPPSQPLPTTGGGLAVLGSGLLWAGVNFGRRQRSRRPSAR